MNILMPKEPFADRIFPATLVLAIAAAISTGLFFRTVPELRTIIKEKPVQQIRTQFVIQEERKTEPKVVPVVKKVIKKQPVATPPVDLTQKKVPEKAVSDEPIPASETKQKVRQVYGLRKVYSKGLGSGGSLSDAVVGKLGNTIDKDYDTLVATPEDIKGQVVSVATVTSPPKFKKQSKPEYTKEMLENRVEGVIRIKALVDIDGKVKKTKLLNDLGFDSAAQALKATQDMEFDPARRGQEPVAVWIIIPIRFVMLS